MYLSLYRKYRSATFDEMVGQEHITTILKNQVKSGKVGHAYLFAGTRGTGKTSAAKILARAVNCESPVDGNPCNECETCKMLLSPSNVDVIEIDAASNNRVDEIREIREKVQFTPVSAKRKVYIIDEVHMLTDSAFNALLKTLEEPPEHAMFILATTEAHKLPATILSRCMRFDFKLIGAETLAGLLKKIFDDQKKKYEPEALSLIAAAGEGSARDAISIADMCISYGDTLRYADVLDALGATDFDTLCALATSVLNKDVGGLFADVDRLLQAGKSVGVLAKDLLKHFRDLLIIKSCKEPKKLLVLPNDMFEKMQKAAQGADRDDMFLVIESLSSIEQDLRYSMQPRIVLEAALLKITQFCQGGGGDRGAGEPKPAAQKPKAQEPQKTQVAVVQESAEKETQPEEETSTAQPPQSASKMWARLVKALKESGSTVLYATCANITGNSIEGGDYKINAGKTEEAILKKPENFAEITKHLEGYNVVVGQKTTSKKDTASDIKKLESLVGKDKLIIN